jgi:cyclophilin family peptidyl-prolyl cis-trans isomerase
MPMLTDPDARVVPSVLNALTKLKAPDLAKILFEHLGKEDVAIRAAAATNIGEARLDGGIDQLLAAYKRGEADLVIDTRSAALEALSKYGAAAAVPVLRTALGDKDWAVRVKAAELLKSLDPTIEIELDVLDAPITAGNFITLARKGYFDGLSFHRVVPNFVIQGGDPRGDGEGGPGYAIRDELNQEPYLRGTVGMALAWRDTGGSQFFITHSPQPHLDARYTVFGRVVSGMEVVDAIAQWDVITRMRVWDGSTD